MEKSLPERGKRLIFLIGAARSGTKIVRDVLSTHPAINAVPYDINFIWRTGNEHVPHDELIPDNFSQKSHNRIDNYLGKYLHNADFLLEKTVSNTIRIPFLLKHYPDAKFIFLYRNGLDVCESVMRQWQSPSDRGYLLEKLRHIPFRELFTYGLKVALRNIGKKKESFFWGVNYPELKDDLVRYPTEVLVAHQWKYCVDKMLLGKEKIDQQRLFEVKYEDFVVYPQNTVKDLLRFIDPELRAEEVNTKRVRRGNIGKADGLLSPSQKQLISAIIAQTMRQLNYEL